MELYNCEPLKSATAVASPADSSSKLDKLSASEMTKVLPQSSYGPQSVGPKLGVQDYPSIIELYIKCFRCQHRVSSRSSMRDIGGMWEEQGKYIGFGVWVHTTQHGQRKGSEVRCRLMVGILQSR